MFRITQFIQEIARPTPLTPKRNPPGPVVIWNLVRRCNLACKHCYSISADTDFPGELTTNEVFTVMDDLKGFRVPVLILSARDQVQDKVAAIHAGAVTSRDVARARRRLPSSPAHRNSAFAAM